MSLHYERRAINFVQNEKTFLNCDYVYKNVINYPRAQLKEITFEKYNVLTNVFSFEG